MKFAIIENGLVKNIIEADVEFAASVGAISALDDTSIGDSYDGVAFTKPVQQALPATFAEKQAAKIAAIRSHFDGLVAGLKADAAPYEVDTWVVQNAEYSAWSANPATPTPYVSALAAARGIPLADLMGKIGVKVAGLATIQGMQQALEDAVKAATTDAELDAVVI